MALDGHRFDVLEPSKVAAYLSLGLVVRKGSRLRLGPLGTEMARELQEQRNLFCRVIDGVQRYRETLEKARDHYRFVLIPAEVAAEWRADSGEPFGHIRPTEADEDMAKCFFSIFQAAGLGLILPADGREAPTRLFLSREELDAFLSKERPRPTLAGGSAGAKEPEEIPADKIRAAILRVRARAITEEVAASGAGDEADAARDFGLPERVRRFEVDLIRIALSLTGGIQRRAVPRRQ